MHAYPNFVCVILLFLTHHTETLAKRGSHSVSVDASIHEQEQGHHDPITGDGAPLTMTAEVREFYQIFGIRAALSKYPLLATKLLEWDRNARDMDETKNKEIKKAIDLIFSIPGSRDMERIFEATLGYAEEVGKGLDSILILAKQHQKAEQEASVLQKCACPKDSLGAGSLGGDLLVGGKSDGFGLEGIDLFGDRTDVCFLPEVSETPLETKEKPAGSSSPKSTEEPKLTEVPKNQESEKPKVAAVATHDTPTTKEPNQAEKRPETTSPSKDSANLARVTEGNNDYPEVPKPRTLTTDSARQYRSNFPRTATNNEVETADQGIVAPSEAKTPETTTIRIITERDKKSAWQGQTDRLFDTFRPNQISDDKIDDSRSRQHVESTFGPESEALSYLPEETNAGIPNTKYAEKRVATTLNQGTTTISSETSTGSLPKLRVLKPYLSPFGSKILSWVRRGNVFLSGAADKTTKALVKIQRPIKTASAYLSSMGVSYTVPQATSESIEAAEDAIDGDIQATSINYESAKDPGMGKLLGNALGNWFSKRNIPQEQTVVPIKNPLQASVLSLGAHQKKILSPRQIDGPSHFSAGDLNLGEKLNYLLANMLAGISTFLLLAYFASRQLSLSKS